MMSFKHFFAILQNILIDNFVLLTPVLLCFLLQIHYDLLYFFFSSFFKKCASFSQLH